MSKLNKMGKKCDTLMNGHEIGEDRSKYAENWRAGGNGEDDPWHKLLRWEDTEEERLL